MTRQWVRVTSGKGAGRVGFIIWIGWPAPLFTTVAFPGQSFPRDIATKLPGTFVRLTEAECAAMEMRG